MARNRAYTRAQARRAYKKAERIVKGTFYSIRHMSDEEILKHTQRLAKNRRPCSCWMCGNPRKWYGHRTLAEYKFGFDVNPLRRYEPTD